MLPENIKEYRAKIDKLFKYAENFASRAEKAGRGTQWPTYRQAARAMRCTYDELEQLIEDYHGAGYMGTAVGCQVGGLGGGVYTYEVRGEYRVEAYL
jgi:hypothetical protein